MSGSLNESKQALVYNAENINLHTDWWGDSDQQRINEAAISFEQLCETLLKNRTPADLQWEETRLTGMLEPLKDLTEMPLKMKELLRVLQKRRLSGGRIDQAVIFTRFYDTLTDIVKRLRNIDPTMLIGTYSGKGGQYVEPGKSRLRGVDREEIKHRFIRGEIDCL